MPDVEDAAATAQAASAQAASAQAASAHAERLRRVASDPRYRSLVARRARLGWILTGTMIAVFFGYILLIAFNKEFLARPIAGGATTIGIPIGLGVILIGILVTGIYVRHANRNFDPIVRDICDREP
ncbi:MAG TPA: DUF485 domain-containing protein [Allosphingosinicella sp.]|jgi:uncharacterized membrane protein (DUF485 family)